MVLKETTHVLILLNCTLIVNTCYLRQVYNDVPKQNDTVLPGCGFFQDIKEN